MVAPKRPRLTTPPPVVAMGGEEDAEMHTSEQINDLAAALAKAQGAFSNAEKDGKNPHLGNRYVTLTSVWDAIRKPLSDNGLAVVQVTDTDNDGVVTLITRLIHASGQYIEATYPIIGMENRGINAAQAAGSALTYARRYSLTSLVGVVADEDDDATTATGERQQRQPQRQPVKQQATTGPAWPQEPAATAPTNGNTGKTTPKAATPQGDIVLPTGRVFISAEQREIVENEAVATRPHWNSVDDAVLWGFDQGCFKAVQHAQNAYNKLRDEAKASENPPKSAKDMFDRWYANVMLRVMERAKSTITDDELDGVTEGEFTAAEEVAQF